MPWPSATTTVSARFEGTTRCGAGEVRVCGGDVWRGAPRYGEGEVRVGTGDVWRGADAAPATALVELAKLVDLTGDVELNCCRGILDGETALTGAGGAAVVAAVAGRRDGEAGDGDDLVGGTEGESRCKLDWDLFAVMALAWSCSRALQAKSNEKINFDCFLLEKKEG